MTTLQELMEETERVPPQRYNLFLGLLLAPALFETVTRRIQRTCEEHGLTGRPIAAERLHVSLLSFERTDEEMARLVSAAAATFSFASFEIQFDTALSFQNSGSARPFVLTSEQGSAQVRALQAALYNLFHRNDAKQRKPPSFTPHMTLVWDKKLVSKHTLQRPLSWSVRDFALIRSHVGKSHYDILGRWPLSE